MINALRKKLNARGRYKIKKDNFNRDIPVLVRTEKIISSEQKEKLRAAGYNYRVVVDNVLSGQVIDIQHLNILAELPFVSQIELSNPLYEEKF